MSNGSQDKPTGKPLNVLIVEDSEADAHLMLRALTQGGFAPVHDRVESAEGMREALRQSRPNVILADYSMPHFGALPALRLVLESGLDIPFIIVSGTIGEESAVEAMRAGAHDYVLKDNLARLAPAVARELREAETRAARRRAETDLKVVNRALRLSSMVNQALLRADSEEDLFRRVCEISVEEGGYRAAWVGLVAGEAEGRMRFVSAAGMPSSRLTALFEPGDGDSGLNPAGVAVRSGQPAFVPDVAEAAVYGTWREQALRRGIRSATALPIVLEGRSLGALVLLDDKPGLLLPEEVARLTELADDLAYGVGALRAHQERNRAEAEVALDLMAMTRLQKLAALSAREGRLEPVLEDVLDAALFISRADFGNIQLLDAASGNLRIAVQRGFPPWWIEFWNAVRSGKGACGTALARGEQIVVEDVEKSPIFMGTPALEIQLKAGVRAVLSTPLISRSDKTVGMLSVHFREPHPADDRTRHMLNLLAGQAADIVEHALAEETIRQSEARYRELVENANSAIIRWRRDGTITFFNEFAQTFFGYKKDEVIGRHVGLLLPEQKAEGGDFGLEQDIARHPERVMHNLNQYVCRDGRRIWMTWTTKPIYDERGEVSEILAVGVDVNDLKLTEEALRQSAEQLRRANADLQQYASAAAHDLQEPLRTIDGYIELLAREYAPRLDLQALHWIRQTILNARRLHALIRGLLEYASVGQPMSLQKVDMEAVLAQTLSARSRLIQDTQATVTHDPLPSIDGDPECLRRIFDLLFDNALKFHEPDHPARVHVGAERIGEEWTITIRDNGIGIHPRYHDRIFTIFQRLHPPDRYPGVGVGLATCRKLLENLGGRIWVESEEGRGAAFRFALPAKDRGGRT